MKSQLINSARQKDSLTFNGAITHSTSLSFCVDLFFLAGASRFMDEQDIITAFERARGEDKPMAYQLLFWARDARGGAGERRFFQVIAKHVLAFHPEEWQAFSTLVPVYGYWKDVFAIEEITEDILNYLSVQLVEDEHANLLAKWFPRKGPWFTAMHKYLKISPKEFRKKLVAMTRVVETQMCANQWSDIDYSKVPSVAMNRNRMSFYKHDEERFNAFNQAVLDGDAKVNASVLFPHELYQAIYRGENETAVEAQWRSLPDYLTNSDERIIPVCDVSGSMTGLPMDVSVALGLYIAERNKGIFKDAFITFSSTPTMEYVQGKTLADKMRSINSAHWGMTTNLEATFDLILTSAIRDNIPEDQMPTQILIISDMEFNAAVRGETNYEAIESRYQRSGYAMPKVVFWNVNGRLGNVPVNAEQTGVGLVSGFSPAILTSVLACEDFTPRGIMLKTLGDKRYNPVRTCIELFLHQSDE
jgi:hypothetical protein